MAQKPGSITFAWADMEYTFRLGIGELRELQDKTGVGPLDLLQRLQSGKWFVDDIRETFRIGLIGGGLAAAEALRLVKRYVDEFPLLGNVLPARAILSAALVGSPSEKKAEAGPVEGAPVSPEPSTSPNSSEPPSSSDLPPRNSIN